MTSTTALAPLLITGVGQRVGLHLARHLLASGRPVIGTYRTERPALDELRDAGAELHRLDLCSVDDVASFATTVQNTHDTLRALIHNASDWLAESGERPHVETFRRVMQVHCEAPYLLNLALADTLSRCKEAYADIIHVGDFVSSTGSTRRIAYAASKAAQDNLTLSFAARLAPKIKVNSIAPALVSFNEDDDDDDGHRANAVSKNLMGREGGYEAFIATVEFLLASPFITGRVVPFDGGRHLA